MSEVKKEEEKKVSVALSTEQIEADLKFDADNIGLMMTKQATNFAYYAKVAEKYQFDYENSKLKLDIIRAELDKEIREEAASSGTKITEAYIEQEVLRRERFVTGKRIVIEKKARYEMLNNILEAFRHKKDMMIQFGMQMREEMRGELYIKQSTNDLKNEGLNLVEKMKNKS